MALSGLKIRVERDRVLGVKAPSEIATEELLARYKRHQKIRLRATTYERLGGILETLKTNLPERAKDISRQSVAQFILVRSTSVSPGTVQKEVTTLKHALKLAVEWELLQNNVAQGAKLPKMPRAGQDPSRPRN